MLRSILGALSATVIALALPLAAQAPAPTSPVALFPFVLPWDDDKTSSVDLSTWLDPLAGAHRFVTAKDGHLFLGNKRLRLLGVNFSQGANFPSHDEADKMAGRLAKFGVGCVRLHNLDGKPAPLGLFQPGQAEIDPAQLDKLDYLVFALKTHGLHVDLVLHEDRVYPQCPEGDGRPSADQGLDHFYPAMIEAQHRFAADLLGHTNPYTKTAYSQEAAVAFLEINPASSLLQAWWSGQLDQLPDAYAKELQAQWNRWLQTRYGADDKLRAQWNAHEMPAGDKELLGAFNGYDTWQVEKNWPAVLAAQPANDSPDLPATVVHVTGVGNEPAGGSYVRYHLPLDATKSYAFTFQAKSDKPRTVLFRAQQMYPLAGVAVTAPLNLTTDWKKFTITFVPAMSMGEARFGFTNLAGEIGEFYFASLSLKIAPAQGLLNGEKLGGVSILTKLSFRGRTPEAQADWLAFLADTEKNYWSGMNRFLKDTVKTSSLVLGGQANLSPSLLQGDLDAIGAAAEWEPPRQPNPAKPDEWIVKNSAMTNDAAGGTLGALAVGRVAGKPFLCTAYAEPFPNRYCAESIPLLAAYAALQDWDAIFVASYSSDLTTMKAGAISDFFDISQNPAKMATLPAAAALFVRGDVQPAAPHVIDFPLEKLLAQIAATGPTLTPASLGITPQEVLRHPIQIGVASSGGAAAQSSFPGITSDTMDLRWSLDPTHSLVTIDTDKSAGIIGFGQDAPHPLSRVTITPHTDWSVITATVLEGESFAKARRVLITAAGYASNTGMKWDPAGKVQSIAKNWGTAPALVEGIGATISLPSPGSAQAWALNEKGEHAAEISVKIADGSATLEIDPNQKTLWYEVDFTP